MLTAVAAALTRSNQPAGTARLDERSVGRWPACRDALLKSDLYFEFLDEHFVSTEDHASRHLDRGPRLSAPTCPP